ncbi:hypothetical protein LP420_03090 [Massilia sp. B-10]|nr:hypothetical protein LP420_03090 [Massilia sp. B-10]
MPTPPPPSLVQLCTRMVSLNRAAKIGLMVGVDLLALPLCFLIALTLRLGDPILAMHYGLPAYVAVAVVTIAAFSLSDLYRAVIRFIDQRLLTATGLALGAAVLCAYFGLLLAGEEQLPRSALAIYWFIGFSYVVTSRISVRNFLRNHISQRLKKRPCGGDLRRQRKRVPSWHWPCAPVMNTGPSASSTRNTSSMNAPSTACASSIPTA